MYVCIYISDTGRVNRASKCSSAALIVYYQAINDDVQRYAHLILSIR
jgi:hypothetical protein